MQHDKSITNEAQQGWLGSFRRVASLRQFVPLVAFNDHHFTALSESCELQCGVAGQYLGDANDGYVRFLLSGQAAIHRPHSAPYEITSEWHFPLLYGVMGNATVQAVSDVEYVSVERSLLDRLLTWSQTADCIHQQISLERHLDADVDWMLGLLHSNLFFKVPPTNIRSLFSLFEAVPVAQGQVIVRQGDGGDYCYFIKEGEASVSREASDGRVTVIATIGAGRCFGEDALVNHAPRNASVVMLTDGVLMRLNAANFDALLVERPIENVLYGECDEAAIILDVRSEAEYGFSHLDCAINIPLYLLALKQRLLNKEREYVCYCDSGQRSAAAVQLLQELGFRVKRIQGDALREALFSEKSQVVANYYLRNGAVVAELA